MLPAIKQLLLSPFLLSFLIAFLATPSVTWLYRHLGWLVYPEKEAKKHPAVVHEHPVPKGGGIAIFLALLFSSLFFLPLDKHLIGILAGALLATVIGVLDDRLNLNPYLRLIANFLCALAVIWVGIGIAYVTNPFDGIIRLDQPRIYFWLLGEQRSIWVLSDFFALFWIVSCMNIVGWSGGVDGQLPGFVAIAAFALGLQSLRFSADITQWPITILAGITAGAYLGFLPFNFYPQKIMPGYGGKSLAGFLLATLAILSTAKVGTLLLVLGIPLVDASYLILKRILRGHSPVWAGREHLHHQLLKIGWGRRRIAVFYWLASLVLAILALNLNSRQKLHAFIMVILVFIALSFWLRFLQKNSFSDSS
jgi:UDP-GlcNAc:undecaprenyl-phosphate GlcNAc-1-phosphate transferase